jgi:hypothetical protein
LNSEVSSDQMEVNQKIERADFLVVVYEVLQEGTIYTVYRDPG